MFLIRLCLHLIHSMLDNSTDCILYRQVLNWLVAQVINSKAWSRHLQRRSSTLGILVYTLRKKGTKNSTPEILLLQTTLFKMNPNTCTENMWLRYKNLDLTNRLVKCYLKRGRSKVNQVDQPLTNIRLKISGQCYECDRDMLQHVCT